MIRIMARTYQVGIYQNGILCKSLHDTVSMRECEIVLDLNSVIVHVLELQILLQDMN